MRFRIQGFDDQNIYNFKFFHQKLPNIHPKAYIKDDQTTGAASDPQMRTSSNKNPNKISADPCGSGSITLVASITLVFIHKMFFLFSVFSFLITNTVGGGMVSVERLLDKGPTCDSIGNSKVILRWLS
jgi:hypothetical protein